jgi:excisionase family DNA binding protein
VTQSDATGSIGQWNVMVLTRTEWRAGAWSVALSSEGTSHIHLLRHGTVDAHRAARLDSATPGQTGCGPPSPRKVGVPDALIAGCRLEGPTVAEPWLSADDIAAHLGVTKDTVYASIAERGMPAHKRGRLWKFQTSEADNWVRSGRAANGSHDSRPRAE